MKALVLDGIGQPLVWKELERPIPGPGQYLIKIHASALNHRDVWIQKGQYAGLKFPIVLGSDGAGVIEAAGEGADANRVGESVLICPSQQWGTQEAVQGPKYKILGLPDDGTQREWVTMDAQYVYPMPSHLNYAQAAALPLAGLTAYRALFSRAGLQRGERVLVTGAGGGVAVFGVQFALAAGAEVWVTSSSQEKINRMMDLGASGGVNYRDEGWSKTLRALAGDINVSLDGAGGIGFGELVKVAAAAGRIVLYGGTAGNWGGVSPQMVFWKQLSILGSTMGSEQDFAQMVQFVADHKIVPVVDSIFSFREGQAAMDKMAAGKQFGKIVIQMAD